MQLLTQQFKKSSLTYKSPKFLFALLFDSIIVTLKHPFCENVLKEVKRSFIKLRYSQKVGSVLLIANCLTKYI
jgi:hypothetical protein